MLTHCVFFWTKEGLAPADLADFEQGLRGLLAIPSVSHGTVGFPAPTHRPSIERSYAFALMLVFEDVAAHDAYQAHAIHGAFHERCKGYWRKVAVYDFADRPLAP